MSYSTPAGTATAEFAKTVEDEGWSVVGVLDRALAVRLLRAVDDVAARSAGAGASGELHLLSGLAQHPDINHSHSYDLKPHASMTERRT